jgi:phosphoribosylglycinamide formyltransferase-1
LDRHLDIAVFGSGRGSNFQAILSAIGAGRIPRTRVQLVVSNNSSAGILDIARKHALLAVHLSQKQFPDERAFAHALLSLLRKQGVNLIVLAGYMKRLPARLVDAYRNRIVNIHPALLPKYGGQGMYGMHVHEAVIASGDQVSGVTVHLVDEEYDHGQILLQRSVPVLQGDTPQTLAARVLPVEHELYPEAIRMIAEGKILLGIRQSAVQEH